MKSMVGMILVFWGIYQMLFNWMEKQKEEEKRLEEIICFLNKSRYAMETEKLQLISYFREYNGKDEAFRQVLQEVAYDLSQNCYPSGYEVWEKVLRDKKQMLGLNKDSFSRLVQVGNGFFGKSRNENISFLEKCKQELEIEYRKITEKHTKERKVWFPVGMLGGLMLIIIWI